MSNSLHEIAEFVHRLIEDDLEHFRNGRITAYSLRISITTFVNAKLRDPDYHGEPRCNFIKLYKILGMTDVELDVIMATELH